MINMVFHVMKKRGKKREEGKDNINIWCKFNGAGTIVISKNTSF